jgi:glycosyltransferase involved in cell wall biosynthesis
MIPVEWVMFLSASGYSQAAQDMVLALDESGEFDVRIVPFGPWKHPESASLGRRHKLASLQKKKQDKSAVQVFHCIPPLHSRVPKLDLSLGYGTFEAINPPDRWIESLKVHRAVICPSEFNIRQFENSGLPCYKIPHIIDTDVFSDDKQGIEGRDSYTFLYFGTWSRRKGWPSLVEAFLREFEDCDAKLVIKTDDVETAKRDVSKIAMEAGKDKSSILFEKRVFNELTLPKFFASVDCLVFPTLGEGFGLPPVQCLSVGTPVIGTKWSGCLDYMSEDVAKCLLPEGKISYRNIDKISQFFNSSWAYISVGSIQRAMRFAYENADEMKERALRGRKMVKEKFSKNVAINAFKKIVEEIK